jgi:hypothetical protein
MDDYEAENYEKTKKRKIAASWNKEQTKILQVWAEKASGWAWLHDKSSRFYNLQGDYLTYPSIILNTVASGLGFLSKGKLYYVYLIASLNIISATLSSFQKFLRSTEKAEAHSHFSKIFSSFTRKITLELTLNPEDRKNCVDFCKMCKDEYDRAVTDCPQIPENIIQQFKVVFKHEKNKPEVANGLFHFNNYESITENIQQTITENIQHSLNETMNEDNFQESLTQSIRKSINENIKININEP